ncbi:MAG: aldo/keto reductase [Candidatus Bathyarchaeota archaeon]|nr:MAG: aldo/keto reductase [Candidatus Bathyarchaeota archaeon]
MLRSNKIVSALGLGCFALSGPFYRPDGSVLAYGKVDDDESIRTIHKAIDVGINVFDTADVYGVGHSGRVLGNALDLFEDCVTRALHGL